MLNNLAKIQRNFRTKSNVTVFWSHKCPGGSVVNALPDPEFGFPDPRIRIRLRTYFRVRTLYVYSLYMYCTYILFMSIYKCLNLSFKTALILQFMNGDDCSEREVNLRKSGKSHSLMGQFPIFLDLYFY